MRVKDFILGVFFYSACTNSFGVTPFILLKTCEKALPDEKPDSIATSSIFAENNLGMTIHNYIEKLGLLPHPEGGYYCQLYGNDSTGKKDISTTSSPYSFIWREI